MPTSSEYKEILSRVDFLLGDIERLEQRKIPLATIVFEETILDFWESFSKKLLHDKNVRRYTDLIALAYWCRKTHLLKLKEELKIETGRIGRGIAFHIAPSNVAVNFMYSLIVSMLAGNVSIVRLSEKPFQQVDILIGLLKEMQKEYPQIGERFFLVRYARKKDINDFFSALCDVRIIWGGDETISSLRQSPLKPRAKEICFADRYSISIINADKYLSEANRKRVTSDFYNDTYLTDQNACTSPKLIIWLGHNKTEARQIFWDELRRYAEQKYQIEPIQIIDKLDAILQYAGQADQGVRPKCVEGFGSPVLMRIELQKLESSIVQIETNSGLFLEYEAETITEILPVCTDKLQTVSVLGIEKELLQRFIGENTPTGIDRIVPLGKTMEFSLLWDGYDLIREMSRQIAFDI